MTRMPSTSKEAGRRETETCLIIEAGAPLLCINHVLTCVNPGEPCPRIGPAASSFSLLATFWGWIGCDIAIGPRTPEFTNFHVMWFLREYCVVKLLRGKSVVLVLH